MLGVRHPSSASSVRYGYHCLATTCTSVMLLCCAMSLARGEGNCDAGRSSLGRCLSSGLSLEASSPPPSMRHRRGSSPLLVVPLWRFSACSIVVLLPSQGLLFDDPLVLNGGWAVARCAARCRPHCGHARPIYVLPSTTRPTHAVWLCPALGELFAGGAPLTSYHHHRFLVQH